MGSSSSGERFYVSGASGALGASVVKRLLDLGTEVVTDSRDDRRLRLIAQPEQLTEVRTASDVGDAMAGVTHVIHTSAVNDERCSADPAGSAASAIGGFADTIRAAVEEGVAGMAFQSSMSVFAPSAVPVSSATDPSPVTLAGSYHLAQEILARRSFCERGLPSLGLRTSLVYGPGQERSLDGGASSAIAAAVADRFSELVYWGLADFQFLDDVAAALVDGARQTGESHEVRNLHGATATMLDFGQAVAASTGSEQIAPGPVEFPFPVAGNADGERLETALDAGIRATVETLRWAPRDRYSWN